MRRLVRRGAPLSDEVRSKDRVQGPTRVLAADVMVLVDAREERLESEERAVPAADEAKRVERDLASGLADLSTARHLSHIG